MGLFGKREKKLCPICGKELRLFDGLSVSDGEICGDCENMIRGKFSIVEYWKKRWGASGEEPQDYILQASDPLEKMTVEEIKDMIHSMKQVQTSILEDVGSKYSNIAKVDNCFMIAPSVLEVGIFRAKEYKNKLVATSEVISGEFAKGDAVTVTTDGNDVATKIIDVFLCSNSSTFQTKLAANMGKHKASVGTSAWIILDMAEGLAEGSLIQK